MRFATADVLDGIQCFDERLTALLFQTLPLEGSNECTYRTGKDRLQVVPKTKAIRTRVEKGVVFATIDNPPMSLVDGSFYDSLIVSLETLDVDRDLKVVVFSSADPDYFLSRADVSNVASYTAIATRSGGPGDSFGGTLLRRLPETRVVTICEIAGRTRGAGSEFTLACDMRFASRERAVFGQPEAGVGLTLGPGAMQHLSRLLGRGRALEVLLSSDDYDADLAERYGWVNRTFPSAELGAFVRALAYRIASFPVSALESIKQRVNAVTLPSIDAVRSDATIFMDFARSKEAKNRLASLGP